MAGSIPRRWAQLSRRTRRVIVVTAVLDGVLKTAALADLRRRPAAEVRGSRARWALAVALLNSGGAVPLAYFVRGRRRTPS